MKKCLRELLAYYLSDKLDLDDKLIFFTHLDDCPKCWDKVYNAVKAQHPHYYKSKLRLKMSGKVIFCCSQKRSKCLLMNSLPLSAIPS